MLLAIHDRLVNQVMQMLLQTKHSEYDDERRAEELRKISVSCNQPVPSIP